MPHVLVIDDDKTLAEMLTEYLANEGFKTAAVHDGATGVQAVRENRYDAVILDVMLPALGGMEVLRRIRQTSTVPVIMLTAKGDDIDRVLGLEMGADDYVAKPYFPRELIARLRAILRRQAPDHDAVRLPVEIADLSLDPGKRKVAWNGKQLDLTVSEFNILEVLMRAGERVSTKDELSLQVLGRAREPYDRSIDVHVSNLRRKLHGAGARLEVETVRGFGYRLREQK
jgi:two-component system OmpR family response regulator